MVNFATKVHAAFQTDDFFGFLRFYRNADFLSAVAMSGIADLARIRALWQLFRTYPQPIGDKLPLAQVMKILAMKKENHAQAFLAFHGVKIISSATHAGGGYIQLPKKGTPEANDHPLLNGARLPDKCEYPKGADSMLEAKYEELGMSRANIVFGCADPVQASTTVAEPEVAPKVEPEVDP